MIRFLITSLFTMIIVGCVATGQIGRLPSIKDEKFAGEVTVIRIWHFVGVAISYIVMVDGKEIFGIRAGQHVRFRLDEGDHYIGVKCFGGFDPSWKKVSAKITVSPNKPSFLLVSPANCAEIKQISEKEAQKEMQESEYVQIEQS